MSGPTPDSRSHRSFGFGVCKGLGTGRRVNGVAERDERSFPSVHDEGSGVVRGRDPSPGRRTSKYPQGDPTGVGTGPEKTGVGLSSFGL